MARKDDTGGAHSGERIAKAIARAGLTSRREAEALIAAGRVTVNGAAISSPALNVTAADRVTVDGKPLPQRERTRLFLYHKPRGQVTTHSDPQGRPTIFGALPENLPRLLSVGRLDMNTEGLILLTNDGGLARVLELPATGWLRRYRVRAHGHVLQDRLDGLHAGVIVDGVRYGSIEARLERQQGTNVWLSFAMREGKNREVKNVLGHLGLAVNRLIRVSFGPFQLGELAEGAVEEVPTRVLREQLGARVVAQAGADFSAPILERDEAPAPPPRRQPVAAGDGGPRMAAKRHGKSALPRRDDTAALRQTRDRSPSSFEARARGSARADLRTQKDRSRTSPKSGARAPLDEGAKLARGGRKKGGKNRTRDPERFGGPELARREQRRGRRPRGKRR